MYVTSSMVPVLTRRNTCHRAIKPFKHVPRYARQAGGWGSYSVESSGLTLLSSEFVFVFGGC